jgi:hypothetical protein
MKMRVVLPAGFHVAMNFGVARRVLIQCPGKLAGAERG